MDEIFGSLIPLVFLLFFALRFVRERQQRRARRRKREDGKSSGRAAGRPVAEPVRPARGETAERKKPAGRRMPPGRSIGGASGDARRRPAVRDMSPTGGASMTPVREGAPALRKRTPLRRLPPDPRPPGEDSLYSKMERESPTRRVNSGQTPPRPAVQATTETTRTVSEASHEAYKDRRQISPLERIESLSPAARGIVWSEILGPPRALRED